MAMRPWKTINTSYKKKLKLQKLVKVKKPIVTFFVS